MTHESLPRSGARGSARLRRGLVRRRGASAAVAGGLRTAIVVQNPDDLGLLGQLPLLKVLLLDLLGRRQERFCRQLVYLGVEPLVLVVGGPELGVLRARAPLSAPRLAGPFRSPLLGVDRADLSRTRTRSQNTHKRKTRFFKHLSNKHTAVCDPGTIRSCTGRPDVARQSLFGAHHVAGAEPARPDTAEVGRPS